MSNNKIGKLSGKKFGKLTVIEDLPKQKLSVHCECGNNKIVSKYDVYYGSTTTCGECSTYNDICGQRFGRLVALKRSEKRYIDGSILWECKCDCGNTTYISYTRLVHYKCQSCGCKRNEEVSKRCSLPLEEAAYNYIYAQYKANAKIRKISFLLTKKEFHNLVAHNCYYCGMPPSNSITKENFNGKIILNYSGIDRIDSSLEYTISNCVPACKRCNAAKNDMTHDEFIQLTKIISSRF